MDPVQSVAKILENDLSKAEHLLDLLIWATTPGTTDAAIYDEVLDTLYVHVPDYRKHRDAYIASRAA